MDRSPSLDANGRHAINVDLHDRVVADVSCPRTPSITAASPIIEPVSVESETVVPAPTIVSRKLEPSMRLPAPIETFGPIVDAVSVTSSSMYTGSIDRDAGRHGRRPARAPLLEHRAIRLEQRALLARVVPAFDVDDFDLRALVDHVLERVGEIELALVLRLA